MLTVIIIVVPPTRRRKRSERTFSNISSHQEVQLIWYRYCMSHSVTTYLLLCTQDLHNMHVRLSEPSTQLAWLSNWDVCCLSREQHVVSHLIFSRAGRACWLWAALLLYPATPFSSPTPLCVCLMPCPLRNGTGQPLRSGEVFRSQTPFEKALFPPVQKQISGLPCWDQVYVSVSPPAVCVVWQPCSRKTWNNVFHCVQWIKAKGSFAVVSVVFEMNCALHMNESYPTYPLHACSGIF